MLNKDKESVEKKSKKNSARCNVPETQSLPFKGDDTPSAVRRNLLFPHLHRRERTRPYETCSCILILRPSFGSSFVRSSTRLSQRLCSPCRVQILRLLSNRPSITSKLAGYCSKGSPLLAQKASTKSVSVVTILGRVSLRKTVSTYPTTY